jgi:hypothetical protein
MIYPHVIMGVFSPGGGIGIRGRLRACALRAWRFESSPGHVRVYLIRIDLFISLKDT